jgi:transposase
MPAVAVDAIVFREDLYPRVETSAVMVQKYADDLAVLPPIEVNQHHELIDGWHRWTAHKKAKAAEIPITITTTKDDEHLLELAIERNARFGFQLSTNDKKTVARRLYRSATPESRGAKKQRLAEILSVSYDTIANWLSRVDKDTQEERDAAVQNLYLQCYTQEEIAEAVGMPQPTVNALLSEIRTFGIPIIPGIFAEDLKDKHGAALKAAEAERLARITAENRAAAEHAADFEPPIYNIWKQQQKTNGSGHFGNSEVHWVDNLLYFYTQPFDIVVDPFAGGGSTLDICKRRFRRCWLSDRLPIEERQREIRTLDLKDGLPDLRKRWADVRLVYLDPPYWKQAEGQYSTDPEDLANMSLDEFTATLAATINAFGKKLTAGYVALILQPTQWKAPDRQFTDHVADMLRVVKFPVDMRYSVPYESQQCTAQMVDWAQAERRCLVLTREIVVWRVRP